VIEMILYFNRNTW